MSAVSTGVSTCTARSGGAGASTKRPVISRDTTGRGRTRLLKVSQRLNIPIPTITAFSTASNTIWTEIGFLPCDYQLDAAAAVKALMAQLLFLRSGEIGAPLLIKACHRNVAQGPGFKTENGVTNVAIHELDICRWLLDDEYEDVQCVKVRQSANSNKGYDNPQVMLMRTKKGCFIDVEVQVADGYGYDIQCEVVCENGTVKLPDPYAVVRRSRPAGWDSVKPAESMPIMTDWKERFIEAYDIEFCKWVESIHNGKLTGPSAWDGYIACVAGDALNASRGTSQFLKVETMEKPEMYK